MIGRPNSNMAVFVAPAPGGVTVTGTDGVAVACLAVDLATGVFGDGVITGQADTPLGPEGADEEARQEGGQSQAGPLGQGEDAVVAGRVALGQAGDGAQQVGDGRATPRRGSMAARAGPPSRAGIGS